MIRVRIRPYGEPVTEAFFSGDSTEEVLNAIFKGLLATGGYFIQVQGEDGDWEDITEVDDEAV